MTAGRPAAPRDEILAAGALVLVHLALVAWIRGAGADGALVMRAGALVADAVTREPWRLVTSLFLHADFRHALWNGLSLVVFAVPLLGALGHGRTAGIYLAAGIGGGLAAASVATPGTTIVGSSGAVSGLFGAWVALRLRLSPFAELESRDRIRTWGVALLVLPALLSPVTSTGQRVSVSSHVGGLATGAAIGALLAARMIARLRSAGELPGSNGDPTVPPPDSGWAGP